MTEVRNEYREEFRENFESSLEKWFLKTERIFDTQTNATINDKINFGLRSILKEVRSNENGNLVISYNYEIKFGDAVITPQVEEVEIEDYSSATEESVYIHEEYFRGFLHLFQQHQGLGIKLSPDNLPSDLTFDLRVRDFLHVLFGLDVYDDETPITVSCDWGKGLADFDIIQNDLFIDLPLHCNMTLQNMKFETVQVLSFDFQLKAHLKPEVLQLLGG